MADERLTTTVAKAPPLVTYKRGILPAFIDPRCIVCTTAEQTRVDINLGLGKAWGLRMIARRIPPGDQVRLSKSGEVLTEEKVMRRIGEHLRRGHVPMELQAGRVIAEEEAKLAGIDVDECEGTFVSYFSVLSDIVRRGSEHMVDSATPPTIGETIRAARVLAQLDVILNAGQREAETREILDRFLTLAETHFSPEEFGDFMRVLQDDPKVRTLMGEDVDESVVEALSWEHSDPSATDEKGSQLDLFRTESLTGPQESL